MKISLLVVLVSSPLIAQEVLPPAEQPVPQPPAITVTQPSEQPVVEFETSEPTDRIVLFIDTFKYQSDTLELASKSERSQQNLSSTSSSSSFVSASTTLGIKSYHDGLILGFGITGNPSASSESADGGALFVGYELDARWQFGGLAFIDNHEDRREVKRRLQVDDQIEHTTEISETSISRYSLGLWSKCAFNNYWRGQLLAYYATSSARQLLDKGQQKKQTETSRKYLALTATFGSYVQISQRLTFTPQVNLTYVLPLSYMQTSQTSTSSTAPPVKEKLEFDEQHNISYSLTLAGFRYQL